MPNDRKTEPPTARRLRRARREGDHPISRLLVASAALAGAVLVAPLALTTLQRTTLDAIAAALDSPAAPDASQIATHVGVIVSPVLGAAALGALLVGMWQTRGVLSARPLRWDLGRMSPFGRARGTGGGLLSRLVTSAAALATLAAAWLILENMGAALAHGVGDAPAALDLGVRAIARLAWGALAIALAASALDALHQHVTWRKRHRMTPEEVRRERRENEGDPEIRQARRQAHHELGGEAPLERVAGASLIIAGNPQIAVALGYDPLRDVAPRVLLRGSGALAMSIEALATSHGIPVEHDSELARALAQVPAGHDVPGAHYADVARALQRAGIVRAPSPRA
jgi:flagellar biosynthesis protein FlhB